jgi:hypothetical protein
MTALARPALLASALLCALAAVWLRGATQASFDAVVDDEDRYHLPPPAWLRAFSLGYTEAAADLLWTKALVYFGGQRARPSFTASGRPSRLLSRARYTERYVSSVIDLDPRFRRAYVAGSRLVLYHDRKITEDSVRASVRILERGAAVFPDNGELAFGIAFLNYYELARVLGDKEDRRQARELGARQLRRAALLPGAPPYASLLGSTLLRREGLDDLVLEHLQAMLVVETDPGIRASLKEQLQHETGAAAARQAEAAEELYQRWRSEMGWVDFGLFLLLAGGDEPGPAEVLDPLLQENRRLGLLDEALPAEGS